MSTGVTFGLHTFSNHQNPTIVSRSGEPRTLFTRDNTNIVLSEGHGGVAVQVRDGDEVLNQYLVGSPDEKSEFLDQMQEILLVWFSLDQYKFQAQIRSALTCLKRNTPFGRAECLSELKRIRGLKNNARLSKEACLDQSVTAHKAISDMSLFDEGFDGDTLHIIPIDNGKETIHKLVEKLKQILVSHGLFGVSYLNSVENMFIFHSNRGMVVMRHDFNHNSGNYWCEDKLHEYFL